MFKENEKENTMPAIKVIVYRFDTVQQPTPRMTIFSCYQCDKKKRQDKTTLLHFCT